MLQRTRRNIQLLQLMLREVADAHVLRLDPFAARHALCSREHLDQRRLARAVRTEQSDAIARHQLQIRVAEHRPLRIPRAHVLQRQERIRDLLRIAKREPKRRVDVRRRDQLHALQRFHPALRLTRLGRMSLEAIDVAANVRDLALLPRKVRLLPGPLRRTLLLERRIVAGV